MRLGDIVIVENVGPAPRAAIVTQVHKRDVDLFVLRAGLDPVHIEHVPCMPTKGAAQAWLDSGNTGRRVAWVRSSGLAEQIEQVEEEIRLMGPGERERELDELTKPPPPGGVKVEIVLDADAVVHGELSGTERAADQV